MLDQLRRQIRSPRRGHIEARTDPRTLGKEFVQLFSLRRPFGRDDLAPVPADWRSDGPHFVGLGAPKAGTSWWCDLLFRHPSVVENRLRAKELMYFMHFGYTPMNGEQVATYRDAFAAPLGSICGEWSVYYLYFPLALRHLLTSAPEARLIVMLRDPVDRLVSHINHLTRWRSKLLKLDADSEEIFKNFSVMQEVVEQSLYAVHLRRLFLLVDPARVLVLQYERCRADLDAQLARTYRFLGIDPDYRPEDTQRLVNFVPYAIPKPDDEQRAFLARIFEDDAREVAALAPEIDLALWPSVGP